MGQNSIRSNLSKADIIAEIRLTLSADFAHKKSIIIVEGDDDLSFFNGKFSPDVEIYESFSGKIGVCEIVDSFCDDRVMGIRDLDYDPISSNSRMLYYDFCCLEMMLIASDNAFSNFCYGYYRGPEVPIVLREQVLRELSHISIYRKLSANLNWAINFKGISFDKAFDDNTVKLDFSKLSAQIIKINSLDNAAATSHISAVTAASVTVNSINDLLSITQGHDFLFYFQKICTHFLPRGKSIPGSKEMFRSLICSYRAEDFSATNLYQKLINYQSVYNRHILT